MLNVKFSQSTLPQKSISKWFTECPKDFNNNERPGVPTISTCDENIERMKKNVLANRRVVIRENADDIGY